MASTPNGPFARQPRRSAPFRVPRRVQDRPGLVLVDATWGAIQPMQLAPGLVTIGELELIDHLSVGGQMLDCRLAQHVAHGTIPGATAIPHDQLHDRLDELERDQPLAVFCNGPQCPATADAVRVLLSARWPAERLRYYRGGIHDWVTLGFPLAHIGT